MPVITVPIIDTLNISIQPGDTMYFCKTINSQAGANHPTANINTKPKKLGTVLSVDRVNNTVEVNTGSLIVNLNEDHYLMFSKDRRVNISGILGYFMETEFHNKSTLPAEIFATAVDFVESSK